MAPISIKNAKTVATTKPTMGSGPDSADTPVKQEKKIIKNKYFSAYYLSC